MSPVDTMKQALEFIELHSNKWDGVNGEHPMTIASGLRAAIDEMEKQKPVLWMQSNHLNRLAMKHSGSEMMLARCSHRKAMSDFAPLYTNPLPTEPRKDSLGNSCESECVACVGCAS